MKEILFRGQRIDNGEWVYGHYIENSIDSPCIIDYDAEQFEIKKESVGQSTGLLDKNGNEIFEGDILKSDMFDSQEFTCEFISGSFNGYTYGYLLKNEHFNRSEIIGNIHEDGDK